jgi:L-iditol 2-dehydrogenase
MKAVVKYGELPGQVDYRDILEPICKDEDVKIEIRACAICMTDLHIVAATYPWKVGTPLGHEFCGVVVEAGKNVCKFKVGDRVVACMNGGFAKYVVKNENDWVFPLPDTISFQEGALLEPLAAAVNSVFHHSHILPMDSVLIEGPGVLGLCALQAAKQLGARVMVSGTVVDASRLKTAERLGADRTLNVMEEDLLLAAEEFSDGRGMDTVLECSGSQAALDAGLQVLRYGGQLTQVGIFAKNATVDLGQLVYHDRSIVGSVAYDRETWMRTIRLVESARIDVKSFISETLPLSEWKRGFEKAAKREGFRILLLP